MNIQRYYVTQEMLDDVVRNAVLQYEKSLEKNKDRNPLFISDISDMELDKFNGYYDDNDFYRKDEAHSIETGWHYKVPDDKIDVATITHEYGHIIEFEYLKKNWTTRWRTVDTDLRDTFISRAMRKSGEKLTVTQFKDKYFSRYAKSKRNLEWFAELFQKYELGEHDPFTEVMGEWLEGYYGNRK